MWALETGVVEAVPMWARETHTGNPPQLRPLAWIAALADLDLAQLRALAWVVALADLALGAPLAIAGWGMASGSAEHAEGLGGSPREAIATGVLLLSAGLMLVWRLCRHAPLGQLPFALGFAGASAHFQAVIPLVAQGSFNYGCWPCGGILDNIWLTVYAWSAAAVIGVISAGLFVRGEGQAANLPSEVLPSDEARGGRVARVCAGLGLLAGVQGIVGFCRAALWPAAWLPEPKLLVTLCAPAVAAGLVMCWAGLAGCRPARRDGVATRAILIRIAYGGGIALLTPLLWVMDYRERAGQAPGLPSGIWAWAVNGSLALVAVGLFCGLLPLALFGRIYATADDAPRAEPGA